MFESTKKTCQKPFILDKLFTLVYERCLVTESTQRYIALSTWTIMFCMYLLFFTACSIELWTEKRLVVGKLDVNSHWSIQRHFWGVLHRVNWSCSERIYCINQNLCTTFDFNKRMNRKSFHFMRIPIYDIAFFSCVCVLSSSVRFFMSCSFLSFFFTHLTHFVNSLVFLKFSGLFAIAATSLHSLNTIFMYIFGVRSVFFNFYSCTSTHTHTQFTRMKKKKLVWCK